VKPTPPRRHRQPRLASLTAHSTVAASAFVIRHAKETRERGPRDWWGKFEYAQAAIEVQFPHAITKRINGAKLAHDVGDWLMRNAAYRAAGYDKPPSRWTVRRALAALQGRR
jgi:hypothetical protein